MAANAAFRGAEGVPWNALLAAGFTRNFLWVQNLKTLETLLTTREKLATTTKPIWDIL